MLNQDAAHQLDLQAGGGDHDIGFDLLAGFEPQPGGREPLDLAGHHRHASSLHRIEQISVRQQAEALVPRLVSRREMTIDVVAGGKKIPHRLDQPRLCPFRPAPRQIVEEHLEQHVLPAHQLVGQARRQQLAQAVRDPVLGRHGHHVGG
jgi:hypothetical protein